MAVDSFSRSQLLASSDIHFLLDLTYAGKTYHLSTKSFAVTKDDGTVLQYQAALTSIEIEDKIDLFSFSPRLVSIPISIILPDTDIADLISRGHDFSTSICEISQWIVGDTYEKRRLLLKGTATEPTYGAKGELISFSIESNPFEDRSIIIPPHYVVDSESWPTILTDSNIETGDGSPYPIVFGQPRDYTPGETGTVIWTTPCPKTASSITPDRFQIIVSGELTGGGDVDVAQVNSDGVVVGSNVTPTIVYVKDGRGKLISRVQAVVANQSEDFYARWTSTGSGIPGGSGSVMEGAGDILEYMLSKSTLDVDYGRMGAAKEILNKYVLGFYVNEGVSYWDFIKTNILPILPVSVNVSSDGLYFVPWNFLPTDNDIVADINIQNNNIQRASFVQYEQPRELMNDISLKYTLNAANDRYYKTVNIHGDINKEGATSKDAFLNDICKISFNRYGSARKEISTNVVYDPTTAGKIVTWMAYANSMKTRSITYSFDKTWAWLTAGDIVKITDSDLSFTNIVAFVENVVISDAKTLNITFKIFDSMNL